MAGAGAKKFPAFSKLSSDDVNNYLADQVIMRFATTTARDAAFGGVGEPTLAEGMTAYIDADNSIYTYDGSNWVKMVSASQPVGFVKIASGSLSGSSVTLPTDCLSASFRNYRLLLNVESLSADGDVRLRLRNSGGQAQGANYFNAGFQSYANSNITVASRQSAETFLLIGSIAPTSSATNRNHATAIDIFDPQRSINTHFSWLGFKGINNYFYGTYQYAEHDLQTSYTTLDILTGTAVTMTGSYVLYAYAD